MTNKWILLLAIGASGAGRLAAQQSITIPEGTPVKVHIYGVSKVECNAKVKPEDAANLKTGNWVIQVDQPVTVDGTVVVPPGSLGLLHVEAGYNKKSLTMELATIVPKTSRFCTIQLVSVLGVDESELLLDTEKIDLAPPLPGMNNKYGGTPLTVDVQLTGKLKQATIKVY